MATDAHDNLLRLHRPTIIYMQCEINRLQPFTFTLQVHTTFRKKHPFTLTFRIKAPFHIHIHIQKKDPFTFTLLVHIHIQNITKSVAKKAQKNPKNDKFYDFHSWHPVCSKKSPKSLLANIQTNAA